MNQWIRFCLLNNRFIHQLPFFRSPSLNLEYKSLHLDNYNPIKVILIHPLENFSSKKRKPFHPPEGVIGTLKEQAEDLSVRLVGDMLLLLLFMLLWGLNAGKELPRASIVGRLLLPFVVVIVWPCPFERLFPFTVTTAEPAFRLLLSVIVVVDCCCCVAVPLHSEARSILDPDRRASLLFRRHLSLSICT